MNRTNEPTYVEGLRGNQDVFLANLATSEEFQTIKDKYLDKSERFLGIFTLLGKLDDSETSDRIRACAKEMSEVFSITSELAIKLMLAHRATFPLNLGYIPRVHNDDKYVYISFGARTLQKDILKIWPLVKEAQRQLGQTSTKVSTNPELAFCIYRQYVLKGRKMKDIFEDYRARRLEGFDHAPTITFEEDFRKQYKRVVKGLLVS